MSAMPAYAIRKEREKKKSKSKVVGGRGVYQLRPPRQSRNSINSMKGVYKRPHFTRSSEDHLRGSDNGSMDRITCLSRRRKVPLYYVGTALMCAGLVLVFVSVAIHDPNTNGASKPIRYCGLACLVTGGLLCLIKVLCFSNQEAHNIVFIRRTDDMMMEENTPSDVSSNSGGVIENNMLPGQTGVIIEDNLSDRGSQISVPRVTKGSSHNVHEDTCVNVGDGSTNVSASGTTLHINGLSPSVSSQGACSTQVLITPDSVNSAKF